MNEVKITSKIRTVFKSEDNSYSLNGRRTGRLGSFNVGMQPPIRSTSVHSLIAETCDQTSIHSRSSDVLLRLYSKLSPQEKKIFSNELKRLLLSKEEFRNLTYLAYFVLYRIGERMGPLEEALRVHDVDIGAPTPSQASFGHGNLVAILSHLITHEYDVLSDDDLDQLEEIVAGLRYDAWTRDKIVEIRMRNLETELEDVNPAINTDRDKVIGFWRDVFGSNEIEAQIQSIESLFTEGSFDALKLATCLGRVRVLLMDALKKLAEQISEKTSTPALRGDAEDAEVINWFKVNNILGDNEKKLIRAIYNLSSTEGAHAASSRKEYARIAKNVTYECLVMVIGLVPR